MSDTFRFLPFTIALAALSACSSQSMTADGPAATQQLPSDAQQTPTTTSLSELAQRDVEAFLNRRRPSETTEHESDSAPRQIMWNDTQTSALASNRTPASDGADFQQSPLFVVAAEAQQPKPAEMHESSRIDRDRVRELIVELSKELYRDAAHADMPLRELFLIAATTLVSPDRALNADAIPGLTARERDLLREFQSFFVQLGSSLDGNSDAEQTIVNSIERLRASLRTEPQLKLGSVALCTRVGGFGDFDQFSKYAFLAHSEQQAVVYIEIAGFTSELNQRDEWVTELSQQLVIYSDRDGIPVWREDWQSAVDRSRNKRTDFFVVQLITLPQALSVGKYHMKVRVRDEKSGAEAEASIPFEMVADPKMAAGGR